MKKIILSLLIFYSVLLQAQIQIPQVVGLTSALNSKVDKVTGKSLVADTSIVKLTGVQAGAQVNKIEGIQKNGVDLTITGKKVNVTVPTTAAEIGAQPAGTYATGTGTAYNSNTGDETLTSIKTKLGAASLINSGYLTNTDWSAFYAKQNSLVFGNLTTSTNGVSVTNGAGAIIGAGTAINITTASASSGGLLSTIDWNNFNNKQPSGSYEPAFSKNTAFNKNFGTTAGTVLEGRTFGTSANSAVGDFIQNRNSSAQTGNMWIDGSSKANEFNLGGAVNIGKIYSTNNGEDISIAPSTDVNFISLLDGLSSISLHARDGSANFKGNLIAPQYQITDGYGMYKVASSTLNLKAGGVNSISIDGAAGGAATFSSTVNSTGFLLNGNNLTSSLTTNYIPKWNGSTFVNATAGTDYQLPITLTTNGASGAATFSGNVLNVPNYAESGGVNQTLTTVNGSTSGNIVGSMPFQTANYKKVIIYVNSVSGNATYTFPTQFNTKWNLHTNNLGVSYSSISVIGTSVTITGAINAAGVLIIEGY